MVVVVVQRCQTSRDLAPGLGMICMPALIT